MGREPVAASVGGQRRGTIGALFAIVAVVAACSGGSSSGASPSVAALAGSPVKVTLEEFAVTPDVASVPAGTVTFVANNTGPEDTHELVVIRTDLGARDLPVDDQGKVTEDGPGVTLIGEIEEVAVGETKQADLELTPGK